MVGEGPINTPNPTPPNSEWDPTSKTWVLPPEPGSAAWWRSQAVAAQKRLDQLYALPIDERALQKDLINNLEAQVSSANKEFADAYQKDRDAYIKAQAAAAKGTGATGSGSVGSTVIPPNMVVIEQNPDKPGTFNRYVYRMAPDGTMQKIVIAIDAQNPVVASDFMVSPNGDIFSMRSFDNTGQLRQGENPVFKKDRQYTQVTSSMAPDGTMHTYVHDPRFPADRYDMGSSTDPTIRAQTEALTSQYKATAGKIGVDTETSAFDLEQKRAAVGAGEDVYRKKLTAVEALLKLGKVDEAQKAFSDAQKNWEATASARMREKEAALTKGGEAESRAWWSQKNAPTGEGSAAWQSLYASIPGAAGDSFTQRMARQMGYSDAIDYQRGNTPSWDEFSRNTPQGAYGTRSSLDTPFRAPSIAGAMAPGGTAPGSPPATDAGTSAGGRSIELGGGLYWWDDGSGLGDMFHMAPKATGRLGADGKPEMQMTPTSLDAAGLYSGKSLEDARALAHAWFNGSPQQANVFASAAEQGRFPNSTPSEDRSMQPVPNAPLTGDIEGDRQMYGAPSGVDRYTDDGMGRTRVGMLGQYPGALVSALRPPVFAQGAKGNSYGESDLAFGSAALGPDGLPLSWDRGREGDQQMGNWATGDQIEKDAAYDPTVFNTSPPIVSMPEQNAPWYETAFSDATKRKAMNAIPGALADATMPLWMKAAKSLYNYSTEGK